MSSTHSQTSLPAVIKSILVIIILGLTPGLSLTNSSTLLDQNSETTNHVVTNSINSTIPKLALSSIEILGQHTLGDDIEIVDNTSYVIGTSNDVTTVNGVQIYPGQGTVGGQTATLEYCVIDAVHNGSNLFSRVLSSAVTHIKCEEMEVFDYGIRIIGTVECRYTPCSSTSIGFNMSWNGTEYFTRTTSGGFFYS